MRVLVLVLVFVFVSAIVLALELVFVCVFVQVLVFVLGLVLVPCCNFTLFLVYTWLCNVMALSLLGWNYFFCVTEDCTFSILLTQLARITTFISTGSLLFTSSMIMNVTYGKLFMMSVHRCSP